MYHSITFINSTGIRKNTWADWRLIPTQKPTVAMPEFSNNFVDIPGRNGSIDFTDYLTGGPNYADRSGTFEFYMKDSDAANWDLRINDIANFIHGKKLKFILEDDEFYYYEGRISLSDKNTDGKFPRITITYRVGPFKQHINGSATAF